MRNSGGAGRAGEKAADSGDRAVRWLLETENPSIRFLTLTQLLGKQAMESEAIGARSAIYLWPPVRKILDRQRTNGGWDKGRTWYLPKYKSTVWQLIILSQTGIDPALPEIRTMCDYSFRFQTPEGGFVSGMTRHINEDWGRLAGCLNGNVIASLCRFGLSNDARVVRALDHLLDIQEQDGGWTCRSFGYHSRDKHSCFMGAVCGLEALVECSATVRRKDVEEAMKRACEFLLMHRLLRADHHDWKLIRPEWTRLGAPWLVGYNLLRALRLLTRAGIVDDSRMAEGVEMLRSKRQKSGRWRREVSWPSTAYSSFGRAGTDDKWITLNALLVLKAVP
jgi:hypothetical protein